MSLDLIDRVSVYAVTAERVSMPASDAKELCEMAAVTRKGRDKWLEEAQKSQKWLWRWTWGLVALNALHLLWRVLV